MNTNIPVILSRKLTRISKWMGLIEKRVLFSPEQKEQIYHSVNITDYVAIIAILPDGRIPVVKQYRPAVECHTWEFPAGMLEKGENPKEACKRELLEETGLISQEVINLGSFFADTGRLCNKQHVFAVKASGVDPKYIPEEGMKVKYVLIPELLNMIRNKEFNHQLHIGALLLYNLNTSTG